MTEKYVHHFKDYKDLVNFIVCDKNKTSTCHECFLGQCKDCYGVERLRTYLTTVMEDCMINEVTYSQWISNPVTTLKTITDKSEDFIEELCTKVEKLGPHAFISRNQSTYYKNCKETIRENEVLINLDSAENYAFVVQHAPQGFHWNNNQTTGL